jgi:hypothetical protein
MNIFLVLVVLSVPGQQGHELTAELHREYITASSYRVCIAHAQKRAQEQRAKAAGVKGRVTGLCVHQGESK